MLRHNLYYLILRILLLSFISPRVLKLWWNHLQLQDSSWKTDGWSVGPWRQTLDLFLEGQVWRPFSWKTSQAAHQDQEEQISLWVETQGKKLSRASQALCCAALTFSPHGQRTVFRYRWEESGVVGYVVVGLPVEVSIFGVVGRNDGNQVDSHFGRILHRCPQIFALEQRDR